MTTNKKEDAMYAKTKEFRNSKGKMYHIGLAKEDIGKNVILPGDPGRVPVIAAYLNDAKQVGFEREYNTYTGTKDGSEISVMSTGMGCPSVAIGIEELYHIGARNLIRLGTCGALQPELKLGQIVICTGAVRGDGTTPEYVPLEYPAIADIKVVNALIESAQELGIEPVTGIVRAHDAFYIESMPAREGWKERLKVWSDAGVKVIENESSALFVVSSLLGMRAGTILVVRANNITEEFIDHDDLLPKRIEAATQIAIRAMQKLDKLD